YVLWERLQAEDGAPDSSRPLRRMNARHKELLLVWITAFVGLIALLTRTTRLTPSHPYFTLAWDHHKYIEMARRDPFDFHIAPFGWRVLNPLLARILPFDLETNFTILSFTALWLTAVLTYYMLRRLGFSSYIAFAGLLF